MTKFTDLFPFVLLIIGTFGLLLNEFVFDWGTIATVTFALSNVAGLIALGIAGKSKKKDT
jgi:hypothetical protein